VVSVENMVLFVLPFGQVNVMVILGGEGCGCRSGIGGTFEKIADL
jgi:hypothetical protein